MLIKMSSPPKIKRSLPEIVTLQSVKNYKGNSIKENIPPTTSMESQLKSNRLLIDKQCQATPKKRALNEEPVTPNANFKLLTSLAAAQEYANCSAPKKIKDESCSNDALVLFDNRTCDDSDIPFNPPSRKEKSLSLICTRFLDMYPMYPNINEPIVVSLDEACTKLAIERRRLYDIVNVFESISMLGKQAKNQYLWYGKNYLMKALQKLKSGAIKESILEKLQYVLEFEDSFPESKPSCILTEVRDFNQSFEHRKSSSETPEVLRHPSPIPEMRKEKSLALMSQKFLMLFLVSPAKIISLSVAAKVLNGFQSSDKVAQVKTQIRRLYDIANVLSSIGLIQKEVTIGQNGRKPAFKYIGPNLDVDPGTPNKEIPKHKPSSEPSKMKPKSLVRHSSFQEICAVAEIERNKIYELPNSAPPFQKSFKSENTTPAKTSFSNLVIDLKTEVPTESSPIISNLKDLKTLPLLQKTKSVNLDSETKKPQLPLRSISLPRQSSFKLVNMPKQMLSANGPYYIVNPATREVKKSPTPIGTVLLISPLSIKSTTKEVAPEKKVFNTRTLQLSAEQRDTILKSLNLSLSDGQIAAIQLEGSSKSTDTDVKPRCNLLKIIEKHELSVLKSNDNNVPPNQVTKLETKNGESSHYNTRNTYLLNVIDTCKLSNSNANGNNVPTKQVIKLDKESSESGHVSTRNTNLLNIIEPRKLSTSNANGNSDHVLPKEFLKLDTDNRESINCNSRNDKLLKITEKLELKVSKSNGNTNYVPPKKAIKIDTESSESSHCSTRNASPNSCSSQLDSPLCLCKNVTGSLRLKSVNFSPTVNSCSGNVENTEAVNGINTQNNNTCFKPSLLEEKKTLDNDVLSHYFKKSSYFKNLQFGGKQPINQKSRIQYLITGGKRKREDISTTTKIPLTEIINLSPTSNSCSSDSLNVEVSKILTEENKNDNSLNKSFLIEETIISPIKKHKGPLPTKPLTPTYFTTPPFTAHDAFFEFSNLPLKEINGKAYTFSLSQETVNAAHKMEK